MTVVGAGTGTVVEVGVAETVSVALKMLVVV